MDVNLINTLVSDFEKTGLSRMKVTEGHFTLELEKAGHVGPAGQAPAAAAAAVLNGANAAASAPVPAAEQAPAQAKPEPAGRAAGAPAAGELLQVKAPLVGVYYQAPSPDSLPYVRVGDRVKKGQTVCLIEAMKMMNELKAPEDGIVRGIKAENGQMVQFGQVIIEVERC